MADRTLASEVVAARAGGSRGCRVLGRIGTLRVRLTIAVAILSAAGLTAGGALVVHAVETTVVRAIEDQSRSELHVVGGQLAQGVPLSAIRPVAPWHVLRFVRPDGTQVETRWLGPGEPAPPGTPPPAGPPPGGPPPGPRSGGSAPGSSPPEGLSSGGPPSGGPPSGGPPSGGPPSGGPPSGGPPPCPEPIPPTPHALPAMPPPPELAADDGPATAHASPGAPGGPVGLGPVGVGMAGGPVGVGVGVGVGVSVGLGVAVQPGPGPGRAAPPMLRATAARVGPWSVVQMPLMSPSDGPVEAVALSPLDDVLRSTETLQHVLEIGVPALVVVLTLAAWLLVGRALRPVRRMTQCAAGIADATAAERLAVPPAADELGELARTLNGMLDRLAEGARRQREFVSDASHELRSPIAATRTQIEVALAHPDRAAPAAVLRGVLAEVTRLEVLVADLLALARLDERRAGPHEEIDLDDLVLEDAARSRAVAVDTRRVTAVKVHGERKSLGHLVRNLLDNAARHAASRVEVALDLEHGTPRLIVDDDGPGIPEADRARVFERFTRLSSSRARSTGDIGGAGDIGEAGGAGLGLAVVRRVVEQHGGQVHADRSPLGGARLEVRFPPAALA